ncbi:MAG: alanine--tRNA ligase, partial [bacterium]
HTSVPSSPLIPQADPTLLFTNAGMNQFKGVFLGEETRPYKRAVTVQKCLRAGGKHNDLENVGYTTRHHTFFEMLGNFSFGDYFKEDAIRFGWDFLTRVVGLPKDKLWVTIFREDDEAHGLWERMIGLPPARIVRMGEKDNFWQMGDAGPCGPCSEILIDQGTALGCGKPTCAVGCDCDRYLEIWNLVFMQYDRGSSGTLKPLPKPSIDTGMGLERLAALAQGVHSNYDSDLFRPILRAIEEAAGKRYGVSGDDDRSMRVIADHLRGMVFIVTDGILPSNEGRGYVLRRIIRRAGRYGRLLGLGLDGPFLHRLTDSVIAVMKGAYPELEQTRGTVQQVIEAEEERFLATLEKGEPLLAAAIAAVLKANLKTIPGQKLFELYDTYGYPLDLAADSAREKGLTLDLEGFQAALVEQRERARKGTGFEVVKVRPVLAELAGRVAPTRFVGYERLEAEGMVQAILKGDRLVKEAVEGEEVELALDVTPFYAEGGGQVGDHGLLIGPEGRVEIQETTKPAPDLFLHKGIVRTGRVHEGERLMASVSAVPRQNAARNHTATHLVHAALRELLGPHVKQYGSLVAPNRLRFDFAHFKPLSSRDIDDIESMVNERVRRNDTVQTQIMGVQEAVAAGALAFFGDKYGDQVRVVSISTFSRELCGGTHCRHTGEIGLFRIVSETGVAAGVRRLEAQTGVGAYDLLKQRDAELDELAEVLKTNRSDVLPKVRKVVALLKEKEQELEKLKARFASGQAAADSGQTRKVAGVTVYTQRVDGMEMKDLRALADSIREKLKSGVIVLGSVQDDKASLLVATTSDLSARFPAGELIKPLAAEIGGTGGGRPELAQAGGKNPAGLGGALEKAFELVEKGIQR